MISNMFNSNALLFVLHRELGNEAFRKKDDLNACRLYNESLAFAPKEAKANEESSPEALALANR
jgi:hypothetical protein